MKSKVSKIGVAIALSLFMSLALFTSFAFAQSVNRSDTGRSIQTISYRSPNHQSSRPHWNRTQHGYGWRNGNNGWRNGNNGWRNGNNGYNG